MATPPKATTAKSSMAIGEVVFSASVSPLLQDALHCWAIPFEFNREIAMLLLPHYTAAQRDDIWQNFVNLLRERVPLPLSLTQDGQYVFDTYARDRIIQSWLADREQKAIYIQLNARLYQYFEDSWQMLSAQAASHEMDSGLSVGRPSPMTVLERSLYHQFAAEPKVAFDRFAQLFQEYEWLNAAAVCDRLVVIAQSFADRLMPGQRLWLGYYQAKLDDVFIHSRKVSGNEIAVYRQREQQKLRELAAKVAAAENREQLGELEAVIHNQLGNLAMVEKRFAEAISALELAVTHFRQQDNLEEELAAANNLGLVLLKQGDRTKAIQYFEAMRQRLLAQAPEDKYTLAVLLLNLGNAYAEVAARLEKEPESNEEILQLEKEGLANLAQAVEAFEEADFAYGQGLALASLGRWLLLQGNHDQAIAFLKAALSILPQDSEEYQTVEQWLDLALQKKQLQPPSESSSSITITIDDESLNLMYFASYGYRRLETLLGLSEKYQTGRQLISAGVDMAANTDSDQWLRWGIRQFQQGQFRKATAVLTETMHLARQEGEVALELRALDWLSITWRLLADTQESLECATRLLERARQVTDRTYETWAYLRTCEAVAAGDLPGRWLEIKALLSDRIDLIRKTGQDEQGVIYLAQLGRYAARMGELDDGLAWLQESLTLSEALADNTAKAYYRHLVYGGFAILMEQRGDQAEAVRYAEIAVGQAKIYGNPYFQTEAQLNLIEINGPTGEIKPALSEIELAQAQAKQMDWPGLAQRASYLQSEWLLTKGEELTALHAARHSLELARQLKMKEAELKSMCILGESLHKTDQIKDALYTLETVKQLSQAYNYTDHFDRAKTLLDMYRKEIENAPRQI